MSRRVAPTLASVGRPAARSLATAALVGALACGGKRTTTSTAPGPHDAGDAGTAVLDSPAAALDAASPADAPLALTAASYRVIDTTHAGTVAVTVTWPTAPAALRRSPGRTPCGSERPPRVRLATLHGVADALVILDIDAGKPPLPAAPVRVLARDCAITPPLTLAPGLGVALEVQNADPGPTTIVITDQGEPSRRSPPDRQVAPGRSPADRQIARAQLPVLGHTVAVPLDTPGALAVAIDGAPDDAAVVVAPPHPYAAITDDVGIARFDGVPAGTHAAHAWLPARAGHPAVVATGSVTVAADGDAALTLTFSP